MKILRMKTFSKMRLGCSKMTNFEYELQNKKTISIENALSILTSELLEQSEFLYSFKNECILNSELFNEPTIYNKKYDIYFLDDKDLEETINNKVADINFLIKNIKKLLKNK